MKALLNERGGIPTYTLPEDGEILSYEQYGMTFEISKANKKGPEYIVNVMVEETGEKVGYFYFYTTNAQGSSDPEIRLRGFFINPYFRGRGIANIFMNELITISKVFCIPFKSTAPQHKPMTCCLLAKYGFQPTRNGSKTKSIAGRGHNGNMAIWFD